ncbi:MAG TPA: hypothetical protein VJR46_02930 [Candidatus Dormibacteraeota bacterium]|nr:hypothetical protein [Candidatus Dormibacteraeota bacterium]
MSLAAAASFAALPLAGPLLTVHASSGGTLFGITGFGQSVLSTIDPSTGVVTDIENLAGAEQGQLTSVTGDPIAHRVYAVREAQIFVPPSTILVHDQLLTINSDNGSFTASAIGAVGPGQIVFDSSTGLLYQLNFGGRLSSIDPIRGKTTPVATLAVSPGDILGMTVVPGANTIYVGQSIFSFDTFTFNHAVITVNTQTGATSTSPVTPGRLGFLLDDPSAGLLLTSDNQNLYSLDPSSGVETLISNFNINPQALFFFAGAIDPSTNTVYLHLNIFDFFNPPPVDQIVTINDVTGSFATSTGNLTTSQLESLYFQPQVIVTPDSIAADVRNALASGHITKAGIADTLLSDLNAAKAARDRGQCKTAANIYQGFINDVAAQSGKAITTTTASLLTREALNLQGSCP